MDEKIDPKLKAFLGEQKDRLTSYDDKVRKENPEEKPKGPDPKKEAQIQAKVKENPFAGIFEILKGAVFSLLNIAPRSGKK